MDRQNYRGFLPTPPNSSFPQYQFIPVYPQNYFFNAPPRPLIAAPVLNIRNTLPLGYPRMPTPDPSSVSSNSQSVHSTSSFSISSDRENIQSEESTEETEDTSADNPGDESDNETEINELAPVS